MRFGSKCEDGSLAVYRVGTMTEARELLVLACSTNMMGEFVAEELVMEQNLENLEAFSTRLGKAHDLIVEHGRCRCGERQ